MSDDELIARLRDRTLEPGSFTHGEHVHLAWACLRKWPILQALSEFKSLLMGFATHIGQPCLYHETVTFACLLLVYERIHRHPGVSTWDAFARENPDLLRWKGGPFFDFYDATVLGDRMARFCFVLPRAPGSINNSYNNTIA